MDLLSVQLVTTSYDEFYIYLIYTTILHSLGNKTPSFEFITVKTSVTVEYGSLFKEALDKDMLLLGIYKRLDYSDSDKIVITNPDKSLNVSDNDNLIAIRRRLN